MIATLPLDIHRLPDHNLFAPIAGSALGSSFTASTDCRDGRFHLV